MAFTILTIVLDLTLLRRNSPVCLTFTSDQSDSFRNDEDYEFGANLANYNFKDVYGIDTIKNDKNAQLKVETRI